MFAGVITRHGALELAAFRGFTIDAFSRRGKLEAVVVASYWCAEVDITDAVDVVGTAYLHLVSDCLHLPVWSRRQMAVVVGV